MTATRRRRRRDAGPVRAVARRLRALERRVALAQRAPGGEAALEHPFGLHAEEAGLPHDEVGQPAGSQRADVVREAVGDRGLDRHLREVAQHARRVVAVVRVVEARVGGQARDPLGGLGPAPRLHDVGQLERPSDRLADAPHPLRVGVHDRDRAQLVERPLGGHPRLEHALADELEVARHRPRQPVVEHGHRDVLDRGVDAERQRRRGRRAQDRRLAHEAEQVGHVAAARCPRRGRRGPSGRRSPRPCPRARRTPGARRCGGSASGRARRRTAARDR